MGRLGDRVRPWRARQDTLRPDARTIAVIGAGPAGLATAALLQRRGVRPTVFDRRDEVGGSWPTRYDSLRLNTVRWMSDLPGLRMPREFGRWVGRDDLVAYLRRYATHHDLALRLGVHVHDLSQGEHDWRITVGTQVEQFDGVVVATGHSRLAYVPEWAGTEHFDGRIIHAAEYRSPSDLSGQRVMVVGAGSSGGEIAVDLAGAGVDLVWSVRTAPRVFPRTALGVPTTPFAPIGDVLSERLVDRLAPWIERRIYGERDYLPPPSMPMMRLLARCKEPMTADGIVDLIRSGEVPVVAAVDSFDAARVRLTDGTIERVDTVIAATGYRPGLDEVVGQLDVLDGGRPRSISPLPGLAFVGFRIPLAGTLWAVERDAHVAAAALSRRLH